jgi:hypothetical protein
MSGLRKLKRVQHRKYADAVGKIASRYDRKLPEVLLEFAEPLTATARTEEHFRSAIEFAILAWNLSFLTPEDRANFLKESVTPLSDGEDAPSEIEQYLEMLLARKQALFFDDRRIVVQHQLSGESEDYKLVVAYEIAKK